MPFLYPRLALRKHTYYIRVQVPKHLIFLVKKRNIVYSLHTKDYYEALYRVREESYKVDLQLRSYEKRFEDMLIKNNQIFLDEGETKRILVHRWVEILDKLAKYERLIKSGKITYKDLSFYQPDKLEPKERVVYSEVETVEGETGFIEKPVVDVWDGYKRRDPANDTEYNPSQGSMEQQLAHYVATVLGQISHMGKVDRQALEILADRPNPLPVVTVKNEELKQQHDFGDMGLIGLCFLYKRMRESEEVLYNKIEGIKNGTNPPVPLYFQEVIEAAQSIRKANLNNTCFGPKQLDYPTLVKAWGEEKLLKKNKARTVQSHCSKVLLIADLLGDKHINDLTRKDIKELEKDLLQVPQRCFQKYPNKSIREIIAETKGKKDIKRLDDSTVRDYIVAFGTFVKYLIDEDIVCYDPFQNYHFKCATSAKESYLPFTDDDLKKIFNPQTYPLLDAKQSEDVAKAFIPLLALFLGSRLNELCQLDVDDVQMISGVQCVVIAPDDKETSKTTEEAKRTKTQKSRINPIPQKIIDLGFLEYVEQRKKAGYKKLFDLGYVEGQGSGNAIGKWFSRYLTRIGIKTRLKVFHSFRHLLPQTLTNMRLPPSYAKEIGGWSQNDSSAFSCYQNGHIPITTLRDVVNQMEFPMIDLEALKNRTMDDLIIKPIVKRRRSVLGDKLPKGQKVKLL